MKKALIIILALTLVMSLSVTAFAAEDDYRQTNLNFYYSVYEPTYSVTIPSAIDLFLDEIILNNITATDVSNLNGKTIAISVEDALNGDVSWFDVNEYHDYLIVENLEATGRYYTTLAIEILGELNTFTRLGDFADGRLLFEFTEDDTKDIGFSVLTSVAPYQLDPGLIFPNSLYTGYIIFGIKLV